MSSQQRLLRPRAIGTPHAQQSIRDSTMQLSSLSLRSPLTSQSPDSFIFPTAAAGEDQASIAPSISSALTTDSGTDLTASTTTTNTAAPRGRTAEPSGLSLLLAQQDEGPSFDHSSEPVTTPTAERPFPTPLQVVVMDAEGHASSAEPSERTPLLDVEAARVPSATNGHGNPEAVARRTSKGVLERWTYRKPAAELGNVLAVAVRALPAVILGTLLNILDGISCTSSQFSKNCSFSDLGI